MVRLVVWFVFFSVELTHLVSVFFVFCFLFYVSVDGKRTSAPASLLGARPALWNDADPSVVRWFCASGTVKKISECYL